MSRFLPLCILALLMIHCQSEQQTADKILIRAHILTMDSTHPQAEAMALQNGKLLAVGSAEEVDPFKGPRTEIIDAGNAYVLPAFIEGHGHFSGLGSSLLHLNLLGTKTWEAVLDSVAERAEQLPEGRWITGRGWHQEKWDSLPAGSVEGYPTHQALSRITPKHPVLLDHASGHAIIANRKAMELAGINPDRTDPKGGRIVRDEQGEMTGVFEENAELLVRRALEKNRSRQSEEERYRNWLQKAHRAQQQCYKNGITFFHDAGVSMQEIRWYQRAYEADSLNIRTYVMLGLPLDSLKKYEDEFPIMGAYGGRFTVRSVKAYVDGALGSYGAWMLTPYADKPAHTGQNVTPISTLDSLAGWCLDHGLQFCTHAIGDRANREMLNLYEFYYDQASTADDLRWRIEHAQHIAEKDIPRFGELGVIASIQAIHCTSDAAFFEKRLGPERSAREAYPWSKLWESGAVVGNGTDCPVEPIDPLSCIYAAVSRTPQPGGRSYYPDMALTRNQALQSYTVNNAYMAFRENELGTLKRGQAADFILLSEDPANCSPSELLKTEVLATYQGGQLVYEID